MTMSALSEFFVLGLSFPFPPSGLIFLRLFELRTGHIAVDMIKLGSLNVDLASALEVAAELSEAKDATEGVLEGGGVGDWATTGGRDWLDTDSRRGRGESTLARDAA